MNPFGHLDYPPALDLLRPYSGQWVLHYPIFLNTYCLAFHLGRFLIKEHKDKGSLSSALIQQEHWASTTKTPAKPPERELLASFTEKNKIELFIAGDELIAALQNIARGRVRKIPFTSYRLRWVLLHREKLAKQIGIPKNKVDIRTYDDLVTFIRSHDVRRLSIVTDVEPTANQFVEDLRRRLGPTQQTDFTVRYCWRRDEGDFYDLTPKLYVFSAPLLTVLKQFSSKYCVIDVAHFPPFETYVGAYVRPGTKDDLITDVASAISGYFEAVFDLAKNADSLDSKTLPPWWRVRPCHAS